MNSDACFLTSDGRRYYSCSLSRPDTPVLPFRGTAFPCLIWDHSGTFSPSDRAALAASLIHDGCRYAVCAGVNADDWERDFDAACCGDGSRSPQTDDEHVITTEHSRDDLERVASFFTKGTGCAHEFEHYLVLHVGPGPSAEIDAAVRASELKRAEDWK